MSLLSLAAVLSSPMLVSTFAVTRRTQTVSDFGIASTSPTSFPGLAGVVYPSDDNELKRLPDEQLQGNTITVITQFALRGESKTSGAEYQPDLVVWQGDSYVVRMVNDYAQYANGFVLAICTSIDLVDAPPVTE